MHSKATKAISTDGDSCSKKVPNDPIDQDDTLRSLLMIFAIFTCAFLAMLYLYLHSPTLSKSDASKVKLPKNLEDAKALGRVISNYKDDYYGYVLIAFVLTYIFLQSFAIPGSIFLSILSGFIFPFPLALFLVCLCSSLGATLCYILFSIVGRKLVKKYFPDRLINWKKQVENHEKDMLSYITFLRITPFLPNWFINITAPVLNVSIWPFFFGTFIGVAPPSFGFISAGVELYELSATGDAFSFKSVIVVVMSALISLLPVIFRKKLQKKLQ
ncbi:transmembrane protein 41B isoform X1 [Hydra vulgaris]|uniref:Transmembrane protein 41B n=1 Tax=Hydra vulgaris TaxID=6087 RepID=T2MCT9_HYDVU|nr:transmembrane protein 41B [Hydra vulgaris]